MFEIYKKSLVFLFLSIILGNLLLLNGSLHNCRAQRDYWPTQGWRISPPEEQYMDPNMLEEMITYMKDLSYTFDSVVVIRHGYVVKEKYFRYTEAFKNELFSVTKSFTSALVGIAIEEGYIAGVEEKVVDFFPEYNISNLDERKEAMTIEHLLTMTTGLHWPLNDPNLWNQWMESPDQVKFVLDRPMIHEPGEIFNYNNGASHLLSALIQKTTGSSTLEYAQEKLFGPLGISDIIWQTDKHLRNYGSHGLFLRSRDMAKLGYLYLNYGTWDGQQIVPSSWVTQSVELHKSFSANMGYGYQWWLAPLTGTYYANGYLGQRIFVLPEQDILLIFTAYEPQITTDSNPYFQIINNYIIAALEYTPPHPATTGALIFLVTPIVTIILCAKKKIKK